MDNEGSESLREDCVLEAGGSLRLPGSEDLTGSNTGMTYPIRFRKADFALRSKTEGLKRTGPKLDRDRSGPFWGSTDLQVGLWTSLSVWKQFSLSNSFFSSGNGEYCE